MWHATMCERACYNVRTLWTRRLGRRCRRRSKPLNSSRVLPRSKRWSTASSTSRIWPRILRSLWYTLLNSPEENCHDAVTKPQVPSIETRSMVVSFSLTEKLWDCRRFKRVTRFWIYLAIRIGYRVDNLKTALERSCRVYSVYFFFLRRDF